MTAALTPSEVESLRAALYAARTGGAVLADLLAAHTLAERASLPGTIAELRAHIRQLIPAPSGTTFRTVSLGIVAGLLTNIILNIVDRRRETILSAYRSPG